MSKVRKMLCILLALTMLIVPMSIGANAAPADGKEVALKLATDTPTVAPGDTLTLKLTWDVDDWSRLWGLACYILMYDGSVFGPASDFKTNKTALRMPMGDFGQFVVPENGVQNTLTTSIYNTIAKQMTEEEKSIFTTGVTMTFQVNNDAGYTTGGGITYTDADTVQCEFYLQVAADATPGTYKVGLPHAAYAANKAYVFCCDTGAAKRVAATAIDTTDAILDITVAAPSAGPALTHQARQVKMTVENGAVVKGTEQLRVVSAISQKDWNDYFANTTVDKATDKAIQEVGIVAYKGQADTFNVDTAKAVAQGTATDAAYSAKSTNYIQDDTANSGNYLFGARIEYQSDVFDTTYIAYVKYLDNAGEVAYAFYDTATIYSLNFKTNYTDYTNGYIAWLSTQG